MNKTYFLGSRNNNLGIRDDVREVIFIHVEGCDFRISWHNLMPLNRCEARLEIFQDSFEILNHPFLTELQSFSKKNPSVDEICKILDNLDFSMIKCAV